MRLTPGATTDPPLILIATPLDQQINPLSQRWPSARAMLFIGTPNQTRELNAQMLEALYGITRAETRVARDLIEGYDIEEISERNRVSRNTIRTQIRQLLRKTDTRRQAELVKLLITLPLTMKP